MNQPRKPKQATSSNSREDFDYGTSDRESAERIHAAVRDDLKLALVLDTNVYDQYHFKLDHASFQRIPHLLESTRNVTVLSSLIWETETRQHFERELRRVVDQLKKPLSELEQPLVPEFRAVANATRRSISELNPSVAAKARFDEHLLANKSVPVAVPHDALHGVLEQYFTIDLPFEDTEKKKEEFPDAFALASLEQYAKENPCVLAIVTRDVGVIRYCQKTKHMNGFSTLDAAVDAFQTQAEFDRLAKVGEGLGKFVAGRIAQMKLMEMIRWHPDTLNRAAPYPQAFQPRVQLARIHRAELLPVGPRGSYLTVHSFQQGTDLFRRTEVYFTGTAKLHCTLEVTLSVRDELDGSYGYRKFTFDTDLRCKFSASLQWPFDLDIWDTGDPGTPTSVRAFDGMSAELVAEIEDWPQLPPSWVPHPMA